jgi:hypothetical protein
MSKNSIRECEENEEEIEMKKIKSSFIINNNIVPGILLFNEIIVNVVIKEANENILLEKIILQIDENYKTINVISESLQKFNKKFEYERIMVRFSTNELSIYNLKPSKKNGLPNYDLPSNN